MTTSGPEKEAKNGDGTGSGNGLEAVVLTVRQQIQAWAIGIVVVALLLWVLRGILLPFVAGMAIAYFLDPVADRLENLGLSRLLATIVITIVAFVVGVGGLILLIPLLEAQVVTFVDSLPGYVDRIRDFMVEFGEGRFGAWIAQDDPDFKSAVGDVAKNALNWLGGVAERLVSQGVAFLNLISLLVITPIVAFYLLLDWDRMIERIDAWLPRDHAETIRGLAREVDSVLSGFVRGQGTVCLILGILYAAALTIAGLNFGLIIGLIAGLVSFIPYVGAAIGLLLSVVIALFQFWPDYASIAVIVAIFFGGQALEGNFLTPKLVGSSVRLHPVWIMFALLAFGAVLGFVGVLIAVPVAAVIGVLTRFGLRQYLASPLYLGEGGAAAAGVTDDALNRDPAER